MKPFRIPGKVSPMEARAISSSCVTLAPGQHVGEHATKQKEELLFVLDGEATVYAAGATHKVPAGHVAFVPQDTRHDVANASRRPLTYLYVTAKIPGPNERRARSQ